MKNKSVLVITAILIIGIIGTLLFVSGRKAPEKTPANGQTTNANQQTATIKITQGATPQISQQVLSSLPLEVLQPQDKQTISTAQITVKGKTAANAEVFVNEKELKADKNGNFATTLTLDEGDNYLYVAASDQDGNFAERELVITVATD